MESIVCCVGIETEPAVYSGEHEPTVYSGESWKLEHCEKRSSLCRPRDFRNLPMTRLGLVTVTHAMHIRLAVGLYTILARGWNVVEIE